MERRKDDGQQTTCVDIYISPSLYNAILRSYFVQQGIFFFIMFCEFLWLQFFFGMISVCWLGYSYILHFQLNRTCSELKGTISINIVDQAMYVVDNQK